MKQQGKYALVTGASTGIGQSVAVAFAKEGYFVVLVARRQEKLEETKKLVEEVGGKADVILADLSDRDSLSSLIENIKGKTDSFDILVNVAGIWHGENEVYAGKKFENFSTNVIYDTVNVGLIAPMILSQALIPLMKKGSVIVNLSGTFENGAKGWLPYFVSKRALEDLTVGLAQEVEDKGIKVIGISPSDVATEEYKKYFPDDAKNALSPNEVATHLVELSKTSESGKAWIIKKEQEPRVDFHF